jgi:hypothetical protein
VYTVIEAGAVLKAGLIVIVVVPRSISETTEVIILSAEPLVTTWSSLRVVLRGTISVLVVVPVLVVKLS